MLLDFFLSIYCQCWSILSATKAFTISFAWFHFFTLFIHTHILAHTSFHLNSKYNWNYAKLYVWSLSEDNNNNKKRKVVLHVLCMWYFYTESLSTSVPHRMFFIMFVTRKTINICVPLAIICSLQVCIV